MQITIIKAMYLIYQLQKDIFMSKIENLSDKQLLNNYNKCTSERDFARLCGYTNRIRFKENSEQSIRFNRLGIVFPKPEAKHERHKKRNCICCNKPIWDTNKSGYCGVCLKKIQDDNKLKKWLTTGDTSCQVQTTIRNIIRKYIYDKQNGRCAICGMSDLWNNKPLNFILDHIDGDASNNFEYNLRLICPNCDSQLPTYKSKNKKSARTFRYN